MKVYVVTAEDAYRYGSEIYLVGVFSTKEKAEQVANKNEGKITEVTLDEVYSIIEGTNSKYLGGYVE